MLQGKLTNEQRERCATGFFGIVTRLDGVIGRIIGHEWLSAHMSHCNVRLARSCDSQQCLWSVHNLHECCGDYSRTSSPSACRPLWMTSPSAHQEWGAQHVRSVSAPRGGSRLEAGICLAISSSDVTLCLLSDERQIYLNMSQMLPFIHPSVACGAAPWPPQGPAVVGVHPRCLEVEGGTRPGMSGHFIAGPHTVIHTFTLTPGDTVE